MELNDQQIKEIIAGKHGPNTPALKMKPVVKRCIVEAMAAGELNKTEGLEMLKSDYLVFNFLGIMQLDSQKDILVIYYGREISKWFEEIKARNK